MCKRALVVVLILSLVVSSLALRRFLDIFRRKSSTAHSSHKHFRNSTIPNSSRLHLTNYTIRNRQCRQQLPKACVFPQMCCCPQSWSFYLRQERWRYNNKTKQCEPFEGSDEDCNNFENEVECNRHCGPEIPKAC
ncbi:uncharacterized protein LOC142563875 [Dermacentor variabilis]|uniref:uncharacterized protein LOC142563875 n=1 Tax=Dermacentor variabilis TaxID=34621 RepID=UPI003F5C7244